MRLIGLALLLLLLAAQEEWSHASELARKRDFAAALDAVSDETEKNGVAAAGEMYAEAMKRLANSIGQELAIGWTDPGDRVQSVKGKVAAVGSVRLEVTTAKGPVFVELEELTAETLYNIFALKGGRRKKLSDEDRLRAAWFLLLMADAKTAKKVMKKLPIPKEYLDRASAIAKAAAKDKPDRKLAKREIEARTAYYKTLVDLRDVEKVGAAIYDMNTVIGKYGDTAFIMKHKDSIKAYAENVGKEILLPAREITKVQGIWKLQPMAGAPAAKVWVAAKETTDKNWAQHSMDFSFWVKPGTFRLWIYAWTCCQVTAKMMYQGSEVMVSQQGQQPQPAGIGAQMSGAVYPPRELQASCGHGPDQHKWMWLTMSSSQKFSGGKKDFRLMTEAGDIAISHILVTSTRDKPPTPEQLRELEASR